MRIYYADQTNWQPVDWQQLWRYLNRLIQYIGLTPKQRLHPEHRATKIAMRKVGQRDEELASMDLSLMSHETQYLLKHMLIAVDLYESALERFPNLRDLEKVGPLSAPAASSGRP